MVKITPHKGYCTEWQVFWSKVLMWIEVERDRG